MTFDKLDEESLACPPDEVFEIVSKLGKGSYGSVYKARHKKTGHILAIKKVPVDTDLQEIIKEISIMQQCDSLFIVKYYGSYFQDADLWIIMEYCGAGSVSDLMRLRCKTLTESEIAVVLKYTLKGLEYLHARRKIHRDIKAGNILLNCDGQAKLADFGVAGQLTDTMAKRNTVIGTPFWMAPEVIQEIGYDFSADIWSLGITAIELADGKPPYGDVHPMRALFMIPTKPPPSFRNPNKWSPEFIDFVSQCLIKNPADRPTATQLLEHAFIKQEHGTGVLLEMVADAEELRNQKADSSEDEESGTMVQGGAANANNQNRQSTMSSDTGTATMASSMLSSSDNTMIVNSDSSTLAESIANTLVIVESEDDSGSMQVHGGSSARPDFLAYFDREDAKQSRQQAVQQAFQPFQRAFQDGDFGFLSNLSYAELQSRLGALDGDMAREIHNLQLRYQHKRQPVLEAIDDKKRRQQQF